MSIGVAKSTRSGRRRGARGWAVVAALGAVIGLTGAAAPTTGPYAAGFAPAAAPAQSVAEMVAVGPEPDGTPVSLDTSVWAPSSPGPHPAVLLAHGFGGTKESVATQAAELQGRGYVVVTWTARGFGRSGGRIHLNDPAHEVADARTLVDRLAARDDVRLDAAGDPRVGVMGASYGGALGLMLAGADPRVDGVVAAITWHDLADAFFPQAAITTRPTTPAGRAPVPTPGPFKQVWASTFFLGSLGSLSANNPPSSARSVPATPTPTPTMSGSSARSVPAASGSTAACGRFDPTLCGLFVQASESGVPSDALLALLRSHSPKPTLAKVTAPTFLVQGIADSLFGLDQADATARALDAAGVPVAVRWTDGGHDGPSSQEAEEQAASYAWLDHFVAQGATHESALPVEGFVYPTAPPRRSDSATLWSAPTYPGLGGTTTDTVTVPLAGGSGSGPGGAAATGAPGVLLRPPGGQPASMIAIPGVAALGISLATYAIAALPGQSVAFDTEPVAAGITVVGSPTVTLTVTSSQPTATLFASLWRVAGEQPTLPHALVAPIRVPVTPGTPTTVTVSLPAATYDMPAGSRWRVLVASTEASFANDRSPAQLTVQPGPTLTLPLGTGTRLGTAGSGPDTEARTALAFLAALLVIAGASAGLRRRRRRHEPQRPDLADVPLVVSNLVKTYSDGHRAVDDVSWRAEKGQVVGLLGPNGAGKTTTMRMVMGLIRPDSGTAHILGHPVSAGAQILDHVGALIEGPGFLPHLSGRANLEAYWAATGRRPEDARIDEVLDVAALGGAIERPVKSYSHGMKQRLGIAQAMLGLPELLVLDEPTNGLDPPQIAAMRPILRRYAETGRTVVVSSHMLAEVEMTCTHVVVMHAGRVITSGRVADLVDSDDTTILDVDETPDLARHVTVLREIAGVDEVRVDTPTRLVVGSSLARAAVVQAAVEAGLPVVGVSSRRHLEEVFLGVISDASGGSSSSRTGDAGGPGDSNGSLIERLRQVRAR